MIIGETKTKVDQIWDAFWNSGATTSITILVLFPTTHIQTFLFILAK